LLFFISACFLSSGILNIHKNLRPSVLLQFCLVLAGMLTSVLFIEVVVIWLASLIFIWFLNVKSGLIKAHILRTTFASVPAIIIYYSLFRISFFESHQISFLFSHQALPFLTTAYLFG